MSAADLPSLEAVREHLAASGWQVLATARGLQAARPVDAEPPVEVVWSGLAGVVHFRVGMAQQVPPERRAAAALAVCDVNARLGVGSFQLRQGIIFEVAVYLDHRGAISTRVVDQCAALCRETVRKYGPELAAGIEGVGEGRPGG